jgi:peptide/nickel transport system substrate-binding protein
METPVSPVWKDFAASGIKQPAFDIEAGAQLLEESGYVDSDGDGVRENADGEKLSFELIYRTGLAAADSVVEIVRSNLAKMGVEVTLVPTDAATFSAKVTQGHEYDISYSVWGVIDDVDTALHIIYGMNETLNFMDYNDQEMEDLLIQSRQTVEYEERVKIIDEWQKLFVERMPTVNLFVATNTYAVNTSNFSGYTLSPGNNGVFDADNVVKITPNN